MRGIYSKICYWLSRILVVVIVPRNAASFDHVYLHDPSSLLYQLSRWINDWFGLQKIKCHMGAK
jgi:hypothetical protein